MANGMNDAPSDASKALFQKLRPHCVAVLRHGSSPTSSSVLISSLASLYTCLSTLQDPLSPALIHYVFYPLSQLLRSQTQSLFSLPDRVRELVFLNLGCLARDWWQTWTWAHVSRTATGLTTPPTLEQSTDWKVWEQLLLLGVMALSGGPSPSTTVPNSDETKLAIAQFLVQLLAPRRETTPDEPWEWDGISDLPLMDESEDASIGNILSTQAYPARSHTRAARDVSACAGALAHILKVALDTSRKEEAPIVLRKTMLQLAGIVSFVWLSGVEYGIDSSGTIVLSDHRTPTTNLPTARACAERLRPVLPGMTSALIKLASSRAPAELVGQALRVLTAALVICLGDVVTEAQRPAPSEASAHTIPTSLEDFGTMTWTHEEPISAAIEELDSPSDTDSMSEASERSMAPSSVTSISDNGRPLPWLARTMQPVLVALSSLPSVAAREDPPSQLAMVDVAYALLVCMTETMTWAARSSLGYEPCQDLVRILLDLASSHHVIRVTDAAWQALNDVAPTRFAILDNEWDQILDSLPACIHMVQDTNVQVYARRASVLSILLSQSLVQAQWAAPTKGLARILSPEGQVEQWGGALVSALGQPIPAVLILADEVPHYRPALARLEAGSIDALARMWFDMGSALAALLLQGTNHPLTGLSKSVFAVPMYFVRTAKLERHARWHRSLASLVVANEMLLGISDVLATSDIEAIRVEPTHRRLRKTVHAFAKHIMQEVQSIWQGDVDRPEIPQAAPDQAITDVVSTDTSTELVRGLEQHLSLESASPTMITAGPAVDVSFVHAAQVDGEKRTVPLAEQEQKALQQRDRLRDQCDALLLCMLASAAELLGVAGRTQLLHTLYPVLSAMGRREEMVQLAAQYALDRIAQACAYPSIQSCVLHHTDYVLGAASHRLMAGLRAELYAGQPRASIMSTSPQGHLLSARTAPWVLVQVIQMLGAEALPLVEDAIDEVMTALDKFHEYDDVCDGLLAVLARLLQVMAPGTPPPPAVEPVTKSATDAFAAWYASRHSSEEMDGLEGDIPAEEGEEKEDPNPPPDRLQTIVTEMTTRCLPFLSHASAMIRSRSLDMLADGVRILAPQQRTAELYPLLDRAWPLILARLGTSTTSAQRKTEQDPNVWMHATALIGTMGQYASGIFARRIVQEAWPRWQACLVSLSSCSSFMPRGKLPASTSQATEMSPTAPRIYDEHSALGHMVQAVLKALTQLLQGVGTHIESASVWSMATYPFLVDALDERQAPAIRTTAYAWLQAMVVTDSMAMWAACRAMRGESPPWHIRRAIHWYTPMTATITW